MDIETNKISFCNNESDNVSDTKTKMAILDIIKQKYGINLKFNRANILNDRSINYIKNPHLISVKTTGTNYFLFLTKFNNINCCFYIDRKIKQGYTCPRIISVKYLFDDCVFEDTLFDGEIVKDNNNNWMFLISDIIIGGGELKKKEAITNRFNYIYDMFSNKYKKDSDVEVCPLVVKRLFSYSEYNELITSFIPKLKYGIRGLYFNSINPKHHNHLFLYPKKKDHIMPNKKKEINISKDIMKTFELRKTIQPEIYDLYCYNEKDIVKFDVARLPSLKITKLVNTLFDKHETVYVECKFNNKFNKWEPVKESIRDKLIDIKKI